MKVVPLGKSSASVSKLASKFDAYLVPLNDEAEVGECLEYVKKLSPKADHYPFAYRFEGNYKSNDDGEPSGAAGKPILTLLENKGIDRCFIGIARYFGGSKLGLPRLRKTFVEATELAIENATFGEVVILDCYRLIMTYHDFEEAKKYLSRNDLSFSKIDYGELVEAELSCLDNVAKGIKELLSNDSQIENIGKKECIKEIKNDTRF